MDHKNNVQVVEEENFGWTILSTVDDQDLCEEKLSSQQEADVPPGNETDDRGAAINTHGDKPSVSEQKSVEENEGSDEAEEFSHDEEGADADDELEDYEFDDCGDDGDETKVLPFGDSARGFLWDPEPQGDVNVKQALVEQQPGQKQGLMWTVSLIATLGFFGWAVMSGLSGGGKATRCLKLHPCSIKEGEPVLSTL